MARSAYAGLADGAGCSGKRANGRRASGCEVAAARRWSAAGRVAQLHDRRRRSGDARVVRGIGRAGAL
eukprot:1591087-Prymnesium_polylepis.1